MSVWVKRQDGGYCCLDNGAEMKTYVQQEQVPNVQPGSEKYCILILGIPAGNPELYSGYASREEAQTALDDFMSANYADDIKEFPLPADEEISE